MMPRDTARTWGPRIALTLLAFTATFPLSDELFSTVFYTDDNAIRYYVATLNAANVSYLPDFSAGYYLGWSMAFTSTGFWYLLFKFLGWAAPLQVLYNGAHILWLPALPLLAFCLGRLALDHADERLVFIDYLLPFLLASGMVFIRSGSLHWAIVSVLIPCFAALAVKLEKQPSVQLLAGAAASAAAALFTNPLAILPLTALCLARLLTTGRFPVRTAAAVLSALAINAPHIRATLREMDPAPLLENAYIAGPLLLRFIKLRFLPESNYFLWAAYPLGLCVLLVSALTLNRPSDRSRRHYFYAGALLLAYIPVILTVGGVFAVNQTPLRMVFVAYPLLLAAAAGTAPGILNRGRKAFLILFAAGFLAQIVLSGPLLPSGWPPEFERLIGWIKTNTDRSGRILLEEASHQFSADGTLAHPLYGSHLLPLFLVTADRQYLSGVAPWIEKRKYAHFWLMDGKLLGRPISEFTDIEISKQFSSYNVRWIVCWTPASTTYFKSLPHKLRYEGRYGIFHLFSLTERYSFLLDGQGMVETSPHSIRVKLDKAVVKVGLKYHYHEGMYTEPPLKLEKLQTEDPAGFILVRNPPREFTIRWR